MRHPDITALPPLELPEGVSLHTHREGDEKSWEDIIESAFGVHHDFELLDKLF